MTENDNQSKFKAFIVRKEDRNITMKVEEVGFEFLPTSGILIKVHYSSINYKDRMSCRGDITVTRRFPHIPGIDAVGIIVETDSSDYSIGDKVIASSFDLGMNTAGGFAQYARVPTKCITKLPAGSDLFMVAAIGTAGYTAYLAVKQISQHTKSRNIGKVVVSGATGGVGCLAIYFLKLLGFHVTAITTKTNAENFLVQIGADEIINIENFIDNSKRALLPESFIAGLDAVGGEVLSTILRSVRSNGIVCAAGMVNDSTFSMPIMPFILRAITLTGINADLNYNDRESLWSSILKQVSPFDILKWSSVTTIEKLPELLSQTKYNQSSGRIVVNLIEN